MKTIDKYRKTLKGLTATLYSKINERSRKKGWAKPPYSLEEFRKWFESNGTTIFNTWVMSSWKKELKPSIDRVDVLKKYEFENIQVVTATENRSKGDKEKEILWAKPIKQYYKGEYVARYKSIKEAVELTGIRQSNISKVLLGKGKTAGGYQWLYENPELVN